MGHRRPKEDAVADEIKLERDLDEILGAPATTEPKVIDDREEAHASVAEPEDDEDTDSGEEQDEDDD
jgi:hypothetical protein